jgi:hypothetical protein
MLYAFTIDDRDQGILMGNSFTMHVVASCFKRGVCVPFTELPPQIQADVERFIFEFPGEDEPDDGAGMSHPDHDTIMLCHAISRFIALWDSKGGGEITHHDLPKLFREKGATDKATQ